METKDKMNILRLRNQLGAPLPIIKDIYMKYVESGDETSMIKEIKDERRKIFDKIKQRPTEKTIFICKQDNKVVRVLKCQTQTDYLPRTQEMQEIFHTLLNGITDNKDQIQESYERLVVLANENLQYEIFEIQYNKNALCSFHKGIWGDLIIKGLTTSESMIIVEYEEDKVDIANMVASKILKYLQTLEHKNKIELNDENISKIFDEKMIGKFHELKLLDYQVFFA
jgi:hypothetical protein